MPGLDRPKGGKVAAVTGLHGNPHEGREVKGEINGKRSL